MFVIPRQRQMHTRAALSHRRISPRTSDSEFMVREDAREEDRALFRAKKLPN